MAMDFAKFDVRNYPTLSVRDGYAEWSASYEDTVPDQLDLPLLERLTSVPWKSVKRALDLACGTGRIGAWMRERGVSRIEGIDVTPEMLERASERGIYQSLIVGDIVETGLESGGYDLLVASLVDEHLRDLHPLYREAHRLLAPGVATAEPGGWFAIVGYHPHFLMKGIPTHFHRATGEAVAVEAHVHLLSDHFKGGCDAGLTLVEFHEGVIDEAWAAAKPRWAKYENEPVSFVMVWGRDA